MAIFADDVESVAVPDASKLVVTRNTIYLDILCDDTLKESRLLKSEGFGRRIIGVPLGENYRGPFVHHKDTLLFESGMRNIGSVIGGELHIKSVGQLLTELDAAKVSYPNLMDDDIAKIGSDGWYIYLNVNSNALFTLDPKLNVLGTERVFNEDSAGLDSETGRFFWRDGLKWCKYEHGRPTETLGINLKDAYKKQNSTELLTLNYPYEKLEDAMSGKVPFDGPHDKSGNVFAFTDGFGMYCMTGDGAIWKAGTKRNEAKIIAFTDYGTGERTPAIAATGNGLAALLIGEELRIFSRGQMIVDTELEGIDSWNSRDMALRDGQLYFLQKRKLLKHELQLN